MGVEVWGGDGGRKRRHGGEKKPLPTQPLKSPRVGGWTVSAAHGCGERARHRGAAQPLLATFRAPPHLPAAWPGRGDSQSAGTGSRPRRLLPLRPWLPRRRRCPSLRRLCFLQQPLSVRGSCSALSAPPPPPPPTPPPPSRAPGSASAARS